LGPTLLIVYPMHLTFFLSLSLTIGKFGGRRQSSSLLPPNFPIVSDRLKKNVKCIGYTIKSVGPNSSKDTFNCVPDAFDVLFESVADNWEVRRQETVIID
jgi:rRNA maturation protein Nop10